MEKQQKIVYLSGQISGKDNYKDSFAEAEEYLHGRGYIVINPARLDEVSEGLSYEQYLRVCYQLIDIADIIFMISGWQKSKGANAELSYAKSLGKKVMYQDYYAPFRKVGENEIPKETDCY